MWTKKTQIEQLLPIEFYGLVNNELLEKQSKKWTNNGLSKMFNLWHKYYNTNAHIVIGKTLLTFEEKYVNFNDLEKCIIEVSSMKRTLAYPKEF